jgi:hypothetical protein
MAIFFLTGYAVAAEPCGTVFTVATHGSTTTPYSLARPANDSGATAPITLALLPGGGGHLDLDAGGCPLPDAHISTSAPLRDGLFYESMWLR